MPNIKPTVGRIVWFWPVAMNGGQPLAAIITHVFSDTRINVAVFQPGGIPMSVPPLQVYLHQDDRSEHPQRPYCTWMSYQMDQANKPKGMTCSMALPTGEIAHFEEGRLISIAPATQNVPMLAIIGPPTEPVQEPQPEREQKPKAKPEDPLQLEPAAWIVEDYSGEYGDRVFATELEARDYNTDQQNNGREDQALHAIRPLYEVDLPAWNAKLFAAKIQLGAIEHIIKQLHAVISTFGK